MSDPFTLHALDNGLRVVVERMPHVCSTAVGFFVRAGARDETPDQAGVSHFLEHMMFKGTTKRSWREVTLDFDRMGSTYNAFTSEDRTVYYGWVREGDLERQLELLADMMRSTLPPDEFETERKVILEEIAMAKDHLDHVAYDFLQEKVFAGHPLAWPVLGYENTVSKLTRDTMWNYFQKRYSPERMVLTVAGNVDPADVIRLAETYCGAWALVGDPSVRTPPTFHDGVDVLPVDRFKQQVVALTFPAVGASDDRAETTSVATTILGGNNSRFYWNIVQEGLAPRAGAYHIDFTDCGAVVLYAACQPDAVERVVEAMRREAERICTTAVTTHEVDRVKNKRRTALAVEAETPYHRLLHLMDDLEFHGAPRTVEQRLAEVDAVTPQSILDCFEAFPLNRDGHLISVGPRRWPE